MLRNDSESWGLPARLFHWGMAVLILGQIALGWTAAAWRLSPLKLDLFVWHKSFGLLILLLALLRLLWRLASVAPQPPQGTPAWEHHAARAGHALLYAMMIALPLTGWVISSASGVPFRVFWLVPLPAVVEVSTQTTDLAAGVHLALVVALSLLLLVHIGAALRHHFVRRNQVLMRMLRPGAGK